jgi:uncharacterized protein
MEKEIRSVGSDLAEVRGSNSSRQIEGYGIVFNSESRDLGGFKEVILPGAVDGVIDRSDILVLMNHDMSRGVLARSVNGKGSLKLTVDKKGVRYAFEAPSFDLGNELVEGVRRADIRASSFAFTVAQGGDKWIKQGDGTYLRTISKFDALFDMSPCYREAYEDTNIALRNLSEVRKVDEGEGETKPAGANTTSGPIADPVPESYFKALESKLNYKS